jgi:hypothetical protein
MAAAVKTTEQLVAHHPITKNKAVVHSITMEVIRHLAVFGNRAVPAVALSNKTAPVVLVFLVAVPAVAVALSEKAVTVKHIPSISFVRAVWFMIFVAALRIIPQLWIVAIITNTPYQRNSVRASLFTPNAVA